MVLKRTPETPGAHIHAHTKELKKEKGEERSRKGLCSAFNHTPTRLRGSARALKHASSLVPFSLLLLLLLLSFRSLSHAHAQKKKNKERRQQTTRVHISCAVYNAATHLGFAETVLPR